MIKKNFINKLVALVAFGAMFSVFGKDNFMTNEFLFFIKENTDKPANAKLLFTPDKTPSIISAKEDVNYEAGRDYEWIPGTDTLTLTPQSRIPFKTIEEMYPPKNSPQSIGPATNGKTNLFFSGGSVFHNLQVKASYPYSNGKMPSFVTDKGILPKSIEKLNAKKDFNLAVLGDSISEGYNASGFSKINVPPYQLPYAGLVAKDLGARFSTKVTLFNHSLSGQNSAWGLKVAPNVIAPETDLLIIAFGMNDTGNPEGFSDNIRKIMEVLRAKNHDAEFILVSPMLGNFEWARLDKERFLKYRDELLKLETSGVRVANLTDIFAELLKKKRFADLTGNGVNHPNDFTHRIYADCILELLPAK